MWSPFPSPLPPAPEPFPCFPSPCPHCPPHRRYPRPPLLECSLRKPLWMVIPPGGVHIPCPVHPGGHHIFGPQVTW